MVIIGSLIIAICGLSSSFSKEDNNMAIPIFDTILINGEWLPAANGRYAIINPATEEIAGYAPECSIVQVDDAVRAAREAFDNGPWPRMSGEERGKLLAKAAEKLAAAIPDLLDITINETGAVTGVAEQLHLGMSVTRLEKYAAIAAMSQEVVVPRIDVDAGAAGAACSEGVVVRDPVGVVAVIAPYNAPVLVSSGKIAPALAMGNTVVVKPPPAAPMGILAMCRILAAELPPGVINIVSGTDMAIGEALTGGDIDMVSFTGSTAVGQKIQQVCGKRMKRSLMELGGKSANIIFADCDQEKALQTAMSTWTFQTGQACIAPTRLLIEKSIYDSFTEKMVASAQQLKIGDPREEGVVVGPLISAEQLERVESYVRVAQSEGAVVACGGQRPKHMTRGYYFQPTLITHATNTMKVAREEIFGPVIVAIPFSTEEEAVRLSNATDYGLSGYVWSGNKARAIKVARQMRTGSVQINGTPPRPDTPFGGYKQSGIGRDNGLYSINAYTELKFIGWPPE
jgi:acyl-CoA reductase-like NAD-dependent aldehyde dehydrogenase